MAQRIGQRTVRFDHPPGILGYASVVGTKEAAGPLRGTFDVVGEDSHFGQKTWELAESQMQKTALETAAQKAGVSLGGLDMILAGDLLNQCIGSAFASVQSNVPYLGLYGACSTMAEGLAVGACLIDGGCANRLAAAASSHFCSAERQYRFPLAYGGQRPPTAQWTATASGAVVLDGAAKDLCITHAVIGQMVDLGVKDANNMGAAMAPAAYHTLSMLFEDLDAHPGDFDCIVTGDLADVGASLLVRLLEQDGIDITPVYSDCGSMLYGDDQDVHAGGSGCGCSAAVLCGKLLRQMQEGTLKRLVFAGTGALMSPTSIQQGQAIAGVCHAVVIERRD
ncbi:stage V sporulation protein AD [Intestinibacillus sp. Marseille-P6563]|uniref:stage V sporulation protein AD n=1 Tax=Intestinibacillus sp. Marseille-P6563 TaxID=2364792 RepID=UPI000F057E77|nr:stage V sporulation protein AD [Intestinibacillus sp. Marseille-P6563]